MTDLDLTKAIEAVANDLWRWEIRAVAGLNHDAVPGVARVLVDIAAPLIERQVRERIAADIEAIRIPLGPGDETKFVQEWAHNKTLDLAAKIARGGAT